MKRKKRLRIGFFIDWLENTYHLSLMSGINKACERHDINLLAYPGGAINSPRDHEILRNTIYRYAREETVDALIISSGSIGIYAKKKEMEEFVHSFLPFPIVSISHNFPNVHVIIIDNSSGLKKLITHLIIDHGYKNIGFICGPKNNEDAKNRLTTYKKTLKAFNIPYRAEIITPGGFVTRSGIAAVTTFLDKRKVKLDAIVAANDQMAFGVLEELKRRGISVPNDIAVVGFDNVTISQHINPPLSTVMFPSYKAGLEAVELIYNIY